MSPRAYVLLDIVEGKGGEAAQALRGKRGVVMADPLDGCPEVIMMVVEAPDRTSLAELTVQALASVEPMTLGMRLLPAGPE